MPAAILPDDPQQPHAGKNPRQRHTDGDQNRQSGVSKRFLDVAREPDPGRRLQHHVPDHERREDHHQRQADEQGADCAAHESIEEQRENEERGCGQAPEQQRLQERRERHRVGGDWLTRHRAGEREQKRSLVLPHQSDIREGKPRHTGGDEQHTNRGKRGQVAQDEARTKTPIRSPEESERDDCRHRPRPEHRGITDEDDQLEMTSTGRTKPGTGTATQPKRPRGPSRQARRRPLPPKCVLCMFEGWRPCGRCPDGRIRPLGVDPERRDHWQTRPRPDRIHAGAHAPGRPETPAFLEHRPHVEIHHDEGGSADKQAGSEHDPGARVEEFSGCGREVHRRTWFLPDNCPTPTRTELYLRAHPVVFASTRPPNCA